jgi:mono/diheme cytochrome c family protein
MRIPRFTKVLAALFGLGWTVVATGADAGVLWSTKVRPLFDVHCVKCHGPIEQKSGLELDTPESVLKGGDEGVVVVPGNPAQSRLYQYLAVGADPHMPPKKQLSDADQTIVREWIEAMAAPARQESASVGKPRIFGSIPEAVDTLLAEGWSTRGLQPAAAVDDRLWCRRVYLDLVGRIPSPEEIEAFAALPAGGRREALVDRLLGSEAYVVRMRELWDVFLMGRPKRENHEDRRKQNGWWGFLEEAFRKNRPWNETVRDLLVARGDAPESKGASWFLYERRNEHQAMAEAVAPVVYGTRIDCAQCHDHPLAREIKQAHYWGLVAAFNRSKNIDGGNQVAESAVGGFINFTNLRKESQPAIVTLLNGRVVSEDRPGAGAKEEDADDRYVDPKAKPRVPKFSRRAAFAEAATQDNPLLARAFVNRTWAVVFGRGLVHPVDEMNARNAPSHPELLDWLAADFARSGHDVRRFVRGLVLSRAYGLARGTGPAGAFASAMERPLTAEQLARSWRVAAGVAPDDDALRRAATAALPDVLPREYNATFQQAQFLAHAPGLAELLKPEGSGTVPRLAAMKEPTARVHEAFRRTYGRQADADELAAALALAEGVDAAAGSSSRDLLWALMTSAEFLTMP